MTWEAAAIVGSAALGAYASGQAADAQQSAAAGAGALSASQYKQSREDLAPWRALGGSATRELGSLYFGDQGPAIDEQGNPVGASPVEGIPVITNPVEGNALALYGRGGDTEIAHLTPGETVVPEQVADRLPGGQNALVQAFRSDGADPGRYVVGGNDDSINPRTGMREFDYGGGAGGVSDPSGSDYGGGDYGGGDNRDGGPSAIDQAKDWGATGLKYGGPVGGIIGGLAGYAMNPNTPKSLSTPGEEGYDTRDGGEWDAGGGSGGGYGAPGPGGTAGVPGNALVGYGSQEDAMARFYASPDYRINFDEGARALESSAAARGGLFGGNTGTALTRYGQDYGNRLYNQYANRLSSLAGLGQTATTTTGQFGANAAGQQGNAMLAGGAAGAQGWYGLANSINAGVGNALYSNYLRAA